MKGVHEGRSLAFLPVSPVRDTVAITSPIHSSKIFLGSTEVFSHSGRKGELEARLPRQNLLRPPREDHKNSISDSLPKEGFGQAWDIIPEDQSEEELALGSEPGQEDAQRPVRKIHTSVFDSLPEEGYGQPWDIIYDEEQAGADGELVGADGELLAAYGELMSADEELIDADEELVGSDRELFGASGELDWRQYIFVPEQGQEYLEEPRTSMELTPDLVSVKEHEDERGHMWETQEENALLPDLLEEEYLLEEFLDESEITPAQRRMDYEEYEEESEEYEEESEGSGEDHHDFLGWAESYMFVPQEEGSQDPGLSDDQEVVNIVKETIDGVLDNILDIIEADNIDDYESEFETEGELGIRAVHTETSDEKIDRWISEVIEVNLQDINAEIANKENDNKKHKSKTYPENNDTDEHANNFVEPLNFKLGHATSFVEVVDLTSEQEVKEHVTESGKSEETTAKLGDIDPTTASETKTTLLEPATETPNVVDDGATDASTNAVETEPAPTETQNEDILRQMDKVEGGDSNDATGINQGVPQMLKNVEITDTQVKEEEEENNQINQELKEENSQGKGEQDVKVKKHSKKQIQEFDVVNSMHVSQRHALRLGEEPIATYVATPPSEKQITNLKEETEINHIKVQDKSTEESFDGKGEDDRDSKKNKNEVKVEEETKKIKLIEESTKEEIKIQTEMREDRMFFLPAGHGLFFGFKLGELEKHDKMRLEIFANNQIHKDIDSSSIELALRK